MAFVLIVAVALARWNQTAGRRHAAMAALTSQGAIVQSFDYERQGHDRPTIWPAWIVDSIGVDYFAEVVSLKLPFYCDTNQPQLAFLACLPALEDLDAAHAMVIDTDLEYIQRLYQLRSLNLHDTRVTDEGLSNLKDLVELQYLYLNGTTITDRGLEKVQNLVALKELTLGRTQITDAGLEYLKGLGQLEKLDLHETQVSDVGVARFMECLPKCEVIR